MELGLSPHCKIVQMVPALYIALGHQGPRLIDLIKGCCFREDCAGIIFAKCCRNHVVCVRMVYSFEGG